MLVFGLAAMVAIALFLLKLLIYVPIRAVQAVHVPGVVGWLVAIALITWLMGDRS